jgi:CelD/BcsL family acetyltransferase involved in cellulose biosynthesis
MMELIRSWHRFESLAEPWNALAAGQGYHPFSGHAWHWGCARAYYSEDALNLLVLRRNGLLAAIASLVLVRRPRGPARLELLASPDIPAPASLLHVDEAALAQVMAAMVGLGHPLHLERLDASTLELSRLAHFIPPRSMAFAKADTPACAVMLGAGREAFWHALAPGFQEELARFRKRAEEVGTLSFSCRAPSMGELDAIVSEVSAIGGSGPRTASDVPPAGHSRRDAFLGAITRSAAHAGQLRVLRLRFGERLAAAAVGLESRASLWLLNSVVDPLLARCYPRQLLMHGVITYAFETALESIELFSSGAGWLKPWNVVPRPRDLLRVYPATIAGIRTLAVDGLRSELQGFRKVVRTQMGPR